MKQIKELEGSNKTKNQKMIYQNRKSKFVWSKGMRGDFFSASLKYGFQCRESIEYILDPNPYFYIVICKLQKTAKSYLKNQI